MEWTISTEMGIALILLCLILTGLITRAALEQSGSPFGVNMIWPFKRSSPHAGIGWSVVTARLPGVGAGQLESPPQLLMFIAAISLSSLVLGSLLLLSRQEAQRRKVEGLARLGLNGFQPHSNHGPPTSTENARLTDVLLRQNRVLSNLANAVADRAEVAYPNLSSSEQSNDTSTEPSTPTYSSSLTDDSTAKPS